MINLLMIFILNGMARLPAQPISLQWIEEAINAVSWLAFAIGTRILYQYARANFGLDGSGTQKPGFDHRLVKLFQAFGWGTDL